jgi:aldehyde dehydrogenase (NAD+)
MDSEKIIEICNAQKVFFSEGFSHDCTFRIESLKKLRFCIHKREQDIEKALHEDLGKSSFESFTTEIGIVLEEIDYHICNLKKWSKPARVPSPLFVLPAKSYVYPEPYGCVLLMAPWNYPFQLLMAPLIGAVSAGCCAVVKPSNMSPQTEKVITEIIAESFDPRHVSSLTGGRDVIQQILTQRFDYIFFTGGLNLGKIVAESAAKHLTPVTLELGGKSPCIVGAGASLETAAKRIVWGKFLNAGQTCIAPDYLLVQRDLSSRLLQLMKKSITGFFGENPEKSLDFGRIITAHHFERVSGYLKNGMIYEGGQSNSETRYIAPSILTGVSPESPVMQEEIFGPVLPVVEYGDISEAIDFINKRPRPLALYFFSGKKSEQKQVTSRVSFGGGCINDVLMHVTNPHLPFGGVGQSGMGNYHGKKSFDSFTHYKALLKNKNWLDIPVRYAPYTSFKNKLIRMLMG